MENTYYKEIEKILVAEGYTKKIECHNYCIVKGSEVEYSPTHYTFDRLKKYEIYQVVREYSAATIKRYLLYIEGESADIYEIMEFKELPTKLKLRVCLGEQINFVD